MNTKQLQPYSRLDFFLPYFKSENFEDALLTGTDPSFDVNKLRHVSGEGSCTVGG